MVVASSYSFNLWSGPAFAVTIYDQASFCILSHGQSHLLQLQFMFRASFCSYSYGQNQLFALVHTLCLQLSSEPALAITVMIRASSCSYRYDQSQVLQCSNGQGQPSQLVYCQSHLLQFQVWSKPALAVTIMVS